MSVSALPTINALIDVALLDGSCYPSRVEDIDGRVYTVAAPFGIQDADRPAAGSALELVWVDAGSRYAVPVRFTSLTRQQPPRWQVKVDGTPFRKSRRAFVRGGWGEPVRLRREGDGTQVQGRVVDISERGMRCRLAAGGFEPGGRVDLTIVLGDEVVTPSARVLTVRPHAETEQFDVVVTYEPTEALSRAIRGYILRRQMEERRRLADADR